VPAYLHLPGTGSRRFLVNCTRQLAGHAELAIADSGSRDLPAKVARDARTRASDFPPIQREKCHVIKFLPVRRAKTTLVGDVWWCVRVVEQLTGVLTATALSGLIGIGIRQRSAALSRVVKREGREVGSRLRPLAWCTSHRIPGFPPFSRWSSRLPARWRA